MFVLSRIICAVRKDVDVVFKSVLLSVICKGYIIVTDPRKCGPLPLNGQLVTDVISAVTDTDIYPITRNGWAKYCIRGNRYALSLGRSVSSVTNPEECISEGLRSVASTRFVKRLP
jgi:hypothetical protein